MPHSDLNPNPKKNFSPIYNQHIERKSQKNLNLKLFTNILQKTQCIKINK